MQLIDKDDLIKRIQQRYKENYKSYHVSEYHEGLCDAYYAIHSFLAQQPAIEERKHGHWNNGYECSVCGAWMATDTIGDCLPSEEQHYCYNCGAKMDEVTK